VDSALCSYAAAIETIRQEVREHPLRLLGSRVEFDE